MSWKNWRGQQGKGSAQPETIAKRQTRTAKNTKTPVAALAGPKVPLPVGTSGKTCFNHAQVWKARAN